MKKFVFFLVVNFMFISVCFGQSITINSIGMHKDGEPGNFEVQPGDVVKVSVNFTTIDMDSVEGTYFGSATDSNQSKIRIYPYENSLPSGTSTGSTTIYIDYSSFVWSFAGTEINTSFTFVLPNNLVNKQSFQIALGLWGTDSLNSDTFFGIRNTSYLTIGTLHAATATSGDYQSFLKIITDEETLPPTLITPNSQTDATYDNSSLDIRFQLTEVAMDSTVKLYFSTNPEGLSPVATLTLSNSYTNTEEYNFELDASNFNNSTQYIFNVEGSSSLTHGVTYYVAIGYKDYLGNPEALSSWNKLEYDNKFDFFSYTTNPNDCWPNNFYSQNGNDITLTFNINEATNENENIILQVWGGGSVSREVELDYSFNSGINTFTIRADTLSASENYVALLNGVNYLSSGSEYQYKLILKDVLGNVGYSYPSDPAEFYWNNNVEINAIFEEVSISSTFNSNISDEYQDLGVLKLKTNSGISQISNITFEISSGSVDSESISMIRINDNIDSQVSYIGPGIYSIDVEESVNTNWAYFYITYLINYENNYFTKDDYIEMNIAQEGIETSGNIISYTSTSAKKFMKHCLVVDYENIQPTVTSTDRETPFFRLDLNTNDHTAQLLNITSFRVVGSVTESDLIENRIFLYESNLPTFNLATSQLIQSRPLVYNGITFNINSTISTAMKYYYFTIKISEDADLSHNILGNIVSSADFHIGTVMCIQSPGFPLNSEAVDEMTLPVELSSFTANFNLSDGVGLKWVTESEINVSGYHLYRNELDSFDNSMRINPIIISNGVENGTQKIYSYVDDEVELNTDYYYWLECLEFDGYLDFYGPFKVYTDEDQIEDELDVDRPLTQLLSAYPNPFNPDVNIPYKLIENNSVEISIFNIKGQKVRSYFRDNQEPGNYSIYFDGRDDNGNRLSSGIYFYRMKTNTYSKTNKMILLK